MLSPFEPIFLQTPLPLVFQEQFLFSADAPNTILLEGKMNQVWHHPAWLWPLFWGLAQLNILFPETGKQVPAYLQIIGGRNRYNQPFHKWHRTFLFPNARRYFNAVMIYDPKLRAVTERMGPAGIIQMMWCIEFFAPDKIEILTDKCYLSIGEMRIRLPSFLYPSVCVIETALGAEVIHVDLQVSHPAFGVVFGYDGEFQTRRVTQ